MYQLLIQGRAYTVSGEYMLIHDSRVLQGEASQVLVIGARYHMNDVTRTLGTHRIGTPRCGQCVRECFEVTSLRHELGFLSGSSEVGIGAMQSQDAELAFQTTEQQYNWQYGYPNR